MSFFRIIRAYHLQLTEEDVLAFQKGSLYLECALEQVYGSLKKISNITLQVAFLVILLDLDLEMIYPPASEASRGVY